MTPPTARATRTAVLALFASGALLAACDGSGGGGGQTAPAAKSAASGDTRAVAKYGSHKFTAADFEELAQRLNVRSRKALQDLDKRAMFVENHVVQELVYEKGKAMGLDADEDIREQLRDLERRLVIQKVMIEHQGQAVSEEDVEAYYQANKDQYSTDRVRASHILVKEKDLAEKILADLKADPSKFTDLAAEHSIDKSNAEKGGDLGFFGKGRMVTEFEEAAFGLEKEGELSDIVETRFGFHIIKLTGREDGFVRPLEEVKNQIRIQLVNERRREGTEAFLAKLKEEANFQIDREVLGSLPIPEGRPVGGARTGHAGH